LEDKSHGNVKKKRLRNRNFLRNNEDSQDTNMDNTMLKSWQASDEPDDEAPAFDARQRGCDDPERLGHDYEVVGGNRVRKRAKELNRQW